MISTSADLTGRRAPATGVAAVHESPPEIFAWILALLLQAPVLLSRAALPAMYARGWGRITSIASVHGQPASPYQSACFAAKHGLEGLSKVIALEGPAHAVTSNCIGPGYVRAAPVEGHLGAQASVRGVARQDIVDQGMLAETVIKRLIEPDEVVGVTVSCKSAASYIAGASIALDGDWMRTSR